MDKDELWGKTLAIMLDGVGEDDAKHFFLGQLHPLGLRGGKNMYVVRPDQLPVGGSRRPHGQLWPLFQRPL